MHTLGVVNAVTIFYAPNFTSSPSCQAEVQTDGRVARNPLGIFWKACNLAGRGWRARHADDTSLAEMGKEHDL